MTESLARAWWPLLGLSLAALACGGGGQDIPGTVNAVSTNAQLTLIARRGTATLGAPPTSTLPPATSGGQPTTSGPPPIATTPAPLPNTNPPPTFVPATSTSAPAPTTGGPVVRPNGTVIHAKALAVAPTIDGNLQEWGTLPNTIDKIVFNPGNWSGVADQSVSFAVGWDATFLYFAGSVTDDVHVQTQKGEVLYRGDSLELQLDANLAGDFTETRINSDDYQLGLSPGNFSTLPPEMYLWNPAGLKGVPAGVGFAAQDNGQNGYTIELALPWTLLRVTPTGGSTFGIAFNSSDNDTPNTASQQSMISSVSTRQLLDPTSWGTLQLDP